MTDERAAIAAPVTEAGRRLVEERVCPECEFDYSAAVTPLVLAVEDEMRDRLRAALEAARPKHLVVDGDCWYSCPLAPSEWDDGSACCDSDAVARGVCTCGADRMNAAIDAALGEKP